MLKRKPFFLLSTDHWNLTILVYRLHRTCPPNCSQGFWLMVVMKKNSKFPWEARLGEPYFSGALSCGLSILHAMNSISIIYSRTLATFLVKLPLRIPWPLQSVVKYIARSGMYNTDVFKTLSNICGGAFCKNSLQTKHFSDIFNKKSLSSIF